MKGLITLFFLFLELSEGYGQKKILSVTLDAEVISASVDRVGELYIVAVDNTIQKFDINGQLIAASKETPAPTLFDPRDGSRLFAFFRSIRSIAYLSPSLETNAKLTIDSAFVIDPLLACSSGDHDMWALDAADETLKKIRPRTSTMLVEVKLHQDPAITFSNITFMREYQGFLFLYEKQKGIHVFNGMGRWIKTIAAPSIRYFNFLGEELYYPGPGKLIFTNLYTGEQREMAISNPFEIALVTDERLFLVQKKGVDFLQFKP